MAPRTQIRSLTVNDFSTKSREEIAAENIKNMRVRQLATLKIYFENRIEAIDLELKGLLKKEVEGIDY